MELSKREKYNQKYFYPKYLSEIESVHVVKRISEIGSKTGFIGQQGEDRRREHKYDTWIAKIVKDHLKTLRSQNKVLHTNILDKEIEFQNILDWMIAEKVDAFKYDFKSALHEQELWHQTIAARMNVDMVINPGLDPERIIYRCKNQEYFFYILNHADLKYEGTNMGHCVGGTGYQNKVKNERSIIVSLRDKNNKPHVTTEILIQKDHEMRINGIVSQCQGKRGEHSWVPNPQYLEMIQEFVLYASDYYNDETLSFMNKQYF